MPVANLINFMLIQRRLQIFTDCIRVELWDLPPPLPLPLSLCTLPASLSLYRRPAGRADFCLCGFSIQNHLTGSDKSAKLSHLPFQGKKGKGTEREREEGRPPHADMPNHPWLCKAQANVA